MNPCPPLTLGVIVHGPFPAIPTNVAAIVWLAWTLANVYVVAVATDEPSTSSVPTRYPALGVIVHVRLAPDVTVDAPAGAIEPLGPAVAVIVKLATVFTANDAAIV
jgi:hypothetical protein